MKRSSIQVGGRPVPLPEEVDLPTWALERVRWQNPRIRAILGCLRLVEEVMDSNFAILHCSPERLRKIRQQAVKVSSLVRTGVAPLLAEPSTVPRLEEARLAVQSALEHLDQTVLAELESLERKPEELEILETRKLLCVTIGKIHSFLQEAFGRLMEADPRSLFDADYFLSQRFARDIEEAEWLYTTVDRLQSLVKSLGRASVERLLALAEALRGDPGIAPEEAWEGAVAVLRAMLEDLLPLLREVLALKGIRFEEMEMLDRQAHEIPARSAVVLELRELGLLLEEHSVALDDGLAAGRRLISLRAAAPIEGLAEALQDLLAFVPLWLTNIGMRRALMLEKPGE